MGSLVSTDDQLLVNDTDMTDVTQERYVYRVAVDIVPSDLMNT